MFIASVDCASVDERRRTKLLDISETLILRSVDNFSAKRGVWTYAI